MGSVFEGGAGGTRRAHPLTAVALGVGLPALAAAVADSVWDGHYLMIPAIWLLGGVLVAAVVGGSVAAFTAVAAATVLHVWYFVPPSDTLRVSGNADVVASAAFAALAFAIAATVDQLLRARRRAARTLATLDALLEHAPIGVAFLDRELRFVRANEALGRIAGRSVEEHLDRTLDEVVHRPELTAIASEVLTTGQPASNVEISGTDREGREFHVVAGYYPVRRPDGSTAGVGVVVRDVTASVETESQRRFLVERLTRLQHITGALAAARTTDDVIQVVLDDVRVATAAQAASLCQIVNGQIVVVAADGYAADVLERWGSFPLEAETPFAEAVRTGRVVIARTREEITARWPKAAASLGPGRQAIAALPLLVEGEATGTVGLSFDRVLEDDPGAEAFLESLATQCAEAFLRARLHESQEAAATRLTFLAEATTALASSLDWTETLRRIAELAVPSLADLAVVFVVDGGTVSALEVADRDPRREETVRRIAQRWPAHLNQSSGLGAVARTGRHLYADDITPEQLESFASDHEHAAALVNIGFRSFIAVPMRAHDRIVGLITLATAGPRRLTEDDVTLANELATRAGQAVLNAELFRDRSQVAATLQASLLPPATPIVPGLEVATRFFAVGAGIDVGGDFYDVFRMGTAHESQDRWAVVIGDVRGKGTEAASISGAARHAIRATALHESSPATILRRLNELLLATAEEGELEPRFCTAVVAIVEPRESGARIVLAVGGHPPPMVLRADGRTEVIEVPGTLIGVLPEPILTDAVVELRAGDSFVLYTDGVTERHEGRRFFDEDGLAAVLSRCTGFTASVLAERIETASRAYLEDAPRDDLAVVVVRAPERMATATAASTELPVDASAPTLGRRFVVAVLATLGLDHHAEVASLLVSELVTNAVVHAGGPVRINVESHEDRIRVAVSDGSGTQPEVLTPDERRPSGRGMFLVDVLAARWGVQPAPVGKSVWFELPT